MKKQSFTKFTRLLIFCVILGLTSCETENQSMNSQATIQDNEIIEAKNWYEKSNPELSVLKYTKKIDWNHAIVTDGTKAKVIEVPIILNDKNSIKSDDKSFMTSSRLMFIKDEKEVYKLSHVLITTKKNTFDIADKDFNFYKIKDDFEGYITVLNAKSKVSYINAITKKTSSLTSKIKSDEQTCLAMCKMYDDGSYDVLYIISCGGGASSGGSGSYGGNGGEAPPIDNPCQSSLNDIVSSSGSVSEFISSTIISENNTTRTKNYAWAIFSGPGFKLYSSETGIQSKVTNSDPSLQWQWTSLTHNSIYKVGIVTGGDISHSIIYAQPTIGTYNSIMDLNYNVNFTTSICGLSSSKEGNYSSHKVFNTNE